MILSEIHCLPQKLLHIPTAGDICPAESIVDSVSSVDGLISKIWRKILLERMTEIPMFRKYMNNPQAVISEVHHFWTEVFILTLNAFQKKISLKKGCGGKELTLAHALLLALRLNGKAFKGRYLTVRRAYNPKL